MPVDPVETSERILRSLVPPENWVSEGVFVIRTEKDGEWLVEVSNYGHVYQVIRDEPVKQPAGCTCSDCQRVRQGQARRFGDFHNRCRPRGVLLDSRSTSYYDNRSALLARAISLVLLFEAQPNAVNAMAC